MTLVPVAAVVGLAVATVAADYFLKRAGQTERIHWVCFAVGCLIYAATAFGWLYAMRHLKLATVGAVYAVVVLLLMVVVGVAVFREPLRPGEALGVALAVLSLVLLARYSS